jgi:hypothetical protein
VVRRQLDQLDTPRIEEGSLPDEQSIIPLACNFRECRIDLAAGVGVKDTDLEAHGASGHIDVA